LTAGGKHFIVEFRDCSAAKLNNKKFIQETLVKAAEAARCHVLHAYFHTFEPQGVTGIVALAESHISIHSWPEYGYAAIDIFMCGDKDPTIALGEMIEAFDPGDIEVQQFERK
jgi:S-adenosylmethionine decarboxylase